MARKNQELEDVAVLPPDRGLDFTLNHVGLENVQMQIHWQGQILPARAAAGVSLMDPSSRGIHMSRLFKILTQLGEGDCSWSSLEEALQKMLDSQLGLSNSGECEITFELPLTRKALLSQEIGWRIYPVSMRASQTSQKKTLSLRLKVLYSSTCPCSESLSRQALREHLLPSWPTK